MLEFFYIWNISIDIIAILQMYMHLLSRPHLVLWSYSFTAFLHQLSCYFSNLKNRRKRTKTAIHISLQMTSKAVQLCVSCLFTKHTKLPIQRQHPSKMLLPWRFPWQRPLQGRHVQVVACHRFSDPARVLKVCCVRAEVVSLLDEVQIRSTRCQLCFHASLPPSAPENTTAFSGDTCLCLRHTNTHTHTYKSSASRLGCIFALKNKKQKRTSL